MLTSSLTGLLLAWGAFLILKQLLLLPDLGTLQAIRQLSGQKRLFVAMTEQIVAFFARLLSRFLPLGNYRQKQLQAILDRLQIKQPAHQFTANVLAKSILLGCLGLVFIPLGTPILSLLTAVAAILAFFHSFQAIRLQVGKLISQSES